MADPAYEDDFWSKPGYAGANPPNYLKAALVDGWATITGITRDSAGEITAIQFDPATVPKLGSTGHTYLEYWVYAADGKTRLIDPARVAGKPIDNKRRYSLEGNLGTATGVLSLTGTVDDAMGRPWPVANSPVLLDALTVGSRVRINNRFILAMYYYPRHSNVPGNRSYDQYRNADGTPKHPQRKDIGVLAHSPLRVMGGHTATGEIKTRIMHITAMGDQLAWPILNTSYVETVQQALGDARTNEMMRFYLLDNGDHSTGGGIPGIFRQSIQDLIAWVESDIPPPPSTRYSIRNGQVIAAPRAADRGGLQPVMDLTANGASRATVGVDQPVQLAARLEMPPGSGTIVQYEWTIDGTADPVTNLEDPRPLVHVDRPITFQSPGTYAVRLTVHGQRDGLRNPPDRTLLENYKEVNVVE